MTWPAIERGRIVQVRVALTGPPRVVLGRSVVDLTVPGEVCTADDILARLADVEPRIARYLQDADGHPPAFLRLLVNDQLLDRGAPIRDGGIVTLAYAVAGGSGL